MATTQRVVPGIQSMSGTMFPALPMLTSTFESEKAILTSEKVERSNMRLKVQEKRHSYGDFYSAVLHCVLDEKRCISIPGLGPVASAFQEHHEFPMETTLGKGLRRLFDDTVRIQGIVAIGAWMFGRRTVNTAVILLCKLITCAYGTQVGHYYAHCPMQAPAFCRWLQHIGLLLPPSHHWQHHKAPYAVNFGIVNGLANLILNPLLTRAPFYAVLAMFVFLTFFDVAIVDWFFNA